MFTNNQGAGLSGLTPAPIQMFEFANDRAIEGFLRFEQNLVDHGVSRRVAYRLARIWCRNRRNNIYANLTEALNVPGRLG